MPVCNHRGSAELPDGVNIDSSTFLIQQNYFLLQGCGSTNFCILPILYFLVCT